MARPWRTVALQTLSDETNRPKEREENTVDCETFLMRLLEETAAQKDYDCEGLGKQKRTLELVVEGLGEQGEASEMKGNAANHLTDRLKGRVVRLRKEALVDAMEMLDADGNKPFVRVAI